MESDDKAREIIDAKLIHGYFVVDYDVVWDTAINDIPPLQEQFSALLK